MKDIFLLTKALVMITLGVIGLSVSAVMGMFDYCFKKIKAL